MTISFLARSLAVFLFVLTCKAHPVMNLCRDKETTVFSCQAKNRQHQISLCLADDDNGRIKLIYRSGNSAQQTMQYPTTGTGQFSIRNFWYTKGRSDEVMFTVDGNDYTVYSTSDARSGNASGVLIQRHGKIVRNIVCDDGQEPWPIRLPRSVAKELP